MYRSSSHIVMKTTESNLMKTAERKREETKGEELLQGPESERLSMIYLPPLAAGRESEECRMGWVRHGARAIRVPSQVGNVRVSRRRVKCPGPGESGTGLS